MRPLLLSSCLFAAAAFAQAPPPAAIPHQQEMVVTELKAALGLTDQQVTQLRQVQKDRLDAQRQVAQQVGDKQKALGDLLKSGSTDANAIGRLVLDAEALRQQMTAITSRFQQQALAVLSTEQKSKLKPLEDAMKLRPAFEQAVGLNLLTPQFVPHAVVPGPVGVFGGGPAHAPAPARMLRHADPR